MDHCKSRGLVNFSTIPARRFQRAGGGGGGGGGGGCSGCSTGGAVLAWSGEWKDSQPSLRTYSVEAGGAATLVSSRRPRTWNMVPHHLLQETPSMRHHEGLDSWHTGILPLDSPALWGPAHLGHTVSLSLSQTAATWPIFRNLRELGCLTLHKFIMSAAYATSILVVERGLDFIFYRRM